MASQRDMAVVKVDGTAGLSTITAIHQRLVDAMASAPALTIDLDKADDFDITLIQLVECARRSAASRGITIALAQPARGELSEQLRRGGFLTRPEDRAFWGIAP